MRLKICAAYIAKQRASRQSLLIRVAALVASHICVDEEAIEGSPVERRVVVRALGKWRGSTLSGYLNHGDELTYKCNFRCTSETLNSLCELLSPSALNPNRASSIPLGREFQQHLKACARTVKAREAKDIPHLKFKVAACLYALGQGGPVKVIADACSIGKPTLRKWLSEFAEAVIKYVRPIYMPGKPMPPDERQRVQDQFASRRGIPNCVLACDGTHIPFKPKNKKYAKDYRNYKGWTSILGVAFVDSYYRFFDFDVGYPGRAGDNTVLKHNWLMKAITQEPEKWLGSCGVILGDSGASDGDTFFLNPYYCPTDSDKAWFNLCHSSTRFFVEQIFGIWKSRFRFLMFPIGVEHKLMTQLIFASATLHNMFVVQPRDTVSSCASQPHWDSFFKKFEAHRCPDCTRMHKTHCLHQAAYRQGGAQMARVRKAPSVVRDELCDYLWQQVCAGPRAYRESIQKMMKERVQSKEFHHGF